MSNTETTAGKKPSHYAYQVRESQDGNHFWTRIGAVWMHKEEGFTVQLDSVPLNGRIVCLPPKKDEEQS